MNRFKKEQQKKYNEFTKSFSEADKKNFDFLQNIQSSFESLVNELHVKLFPEEFDFIYDSNVDSIRRARGENPMSEEYIKRMNDKRVKLGFLPLSEDGYPIDSEKTKEYCIKLITKEIEYREIN